MPNPFGKQLAQEEPIESENPFGKNKESGNPFGRQANAPEPTESKFPPLPKSSVGKKTSFVDNVVDLAKHSGTQAKANFSALLATGQWDSFDEETQNQLVEAISVASKAHQQPEELERWMATVSREAEDVGNAWTKGEYGNVVIQSLDFLGETLYESITNPKGFAYANAEQAANLAATWAPGIALGKIGSITGATIGAAGGPAGAATGAMIGGGGGFLVGAGMGSYMIETGAQIREFIQTQGGDMSPENIRKALDDTQLRDEMLSNASKKGLSIATFDAAANLLGLKLLKGATGPASFIKRGVGAEAAQIAGAAGGEIAGQQLATGEINAAEVGQEVALEMGPGGVADIALTAHAARKREVGKKQPEVEEAPLDSVDLIGDVEKPDTEITEKPIAQPADVQPQESSGTQDLTGATPGLGVPKTAQAPTAEEKPPSEPTITYFDPRLSRETYRSRLEGMSEELVAGKIQPIPDPNFVAGESDPRDENGVAIVPLIRPPSPNPEWFVSLMSEDHYSMEVPSVQKAIEKAVAGERLGVRQARVIGAMLEHITGERTSDQEMDYAREQLRIAREARAAAKMPDAQDWLLEEEDYGEDMDGIARTLLEFQEQAKGLSSELAEQVDELLYSDMSDADIISNAQKLFGEYYGRQSEASTQAYQEPEAQSGLPGARDPAITRKPGTEGIWSEQRADDQYAGQRELQTETGLVEPLPATTKSVEIGKKLVVKPVTEKVTESDRRQKKKPGLKKERRKDERRKRADERKRVNQMSEEEKETALLTSDKAAGIRNERAYNEDKRLKYQALFDIDNFKQKNDEYSYEGADQIIGELGQIMAENSGDKVIPYHLHGDEYISQSDNLTALEKFSKSVAKEFSESDIAIDIAGKETTATGIATSYGIGKTIEGAEANLKKDKKARAEAGLRVEREEEKTAQAKKHPGKKVTTAEPEIWKGKVNSQDIEVNTNPTEDQIKAGNYLKGSITVQGLKISIETPKGVKRGPTWPVMTAHYGYIKDTIGADSETGAAPYEIEQVDILVKDVSIIPDDNPVFIINQYINGKFDEVKTLAGMDNEADARKTYLDGYTKGWKGLNSIHELSIEEFKSWLDTGDMEAEYHPVKNKGKVSRGEAKELLKEKPVTAKKEPTTEEIKKTIGESELAKRGKAQEKAKQEEAEAKQAKDLNLANELTATKILDAANVTGADRLDVMAKFRDGTYSLSDLRDAYPADVTVSEKTPSKEAEKVDVGQFDGDFKGQSKLYAEEVFSNKLEVLSRKDRLEADKLIDADEYESLPKVTVPIDSLVPTQKFISESNLEKIKTDSTDTGAYLFEKNEKIYILDGHHRIAKNIAKGEKKITGYLLKSDTGKVSEADIKRVNKLRKTADGMENQIDAKMNPAVGDQNPTLRRSRILANMQADGEKLKRIQTMLRGIADQVESGTLNPLLESVSTKIEIETLLSTEKRPSVMWQPSNSKELFESVAGLRGIKEDREFAKSRLDWRDGILNTEETEVVDRLIKAASKVKRTPFKYAYLLDQIKAFNRAKKLGITNDADWVATREALLALDKPVDSSQIKAKSIDQMERALIGQKIPGFFPTPEPVIERMLEEADISEGERVLEPSAGNGAIMDAIRAKESGAELEGLEVNYQLKEVLAAKDHKIISDDFIEYDGGPYDKIVMNPPFEKNQDIEHVSHAYDLLSPGGRIVAIMSEHPFFANDKASKDFRVWLDGIDHTAEKLAGAFKKGKIRTTGVASRMVVINKETDKGTALFSRGEKTQTESPEFKKWFGDSMVVDSNGKPLIVYHGTPDVRGLKEAGFVSNIEKLQRDGYGNVDFHDAERMFYFVDDKSVADTYADDRRAFDYQNAEPETLALYLSIENPIVLNWHGKHWKDIKPLIDKARKEGYDGAIIRGVKDSYQKTGPAATIYVALHPEQIKSAIGNRGTFDKGESNILLSRGKGKSTALSTNDVKTITSALQDSVGATLQVVDTEASLPKEIKAQAELEGATGEIRAVHWKNQIYIVADQMRDKKDVEASVAHEGQHFLGDNYFGKEKNAAYQALWMKLGGVSGMKKLAKSSGFSMDSYFKTADDLLKKGATGSKERAVYLVDEFLAHTKQQQAYESLPARIKRAIKEFLGKIRDLLRKSGFVELPKANDADISYLLKTMNSAVRGKPKGGVFNKVPAFMTLGSDITKPDTGEPKSVRDKLLADTALDSGLSKRQAFIGALNNILQSGSGLDVGVRGADVGNGYAASVKDIGKSAVRDFQSLGNIISSQAFLEQGYGGLDAETRSLVMARVFDVIHNLKILDSVVESIPVDVMNVLGGKKSSAKMLLHDVTMLKDAFSINTESAIPVMEAASSLINRVALLGTEKLARSGLSNGTILPFDGGKSALGTRKDLHIDDSVDFAESILSEVQSITQTKPESEKAIAEMREPVDPSDPNILFSRTPERKYEKQKEVASKARVRINKWFKRNLTKEGLMNETSFEIKLKSDAIKNVGEEETGYLVHTFEKALLNHYGKKYNDLNKKELSAINEYMKGNKGIRAPKAVKDAADLMRDYLDVMSGKMLEAINDLLELKVNKLSNKQRQQYELALSTNGEEGKIPEHIIGPLQLMQTMENNMGIYMTRSYQAFDDKNWKEKALEDSVLISDAEDFIRESNPDLTNGEVTGAVRAILQDAKDSGNFVALISKGTKVGSKDVSITKKRKDVPEIIRRLLGEYNDPKLNFARSASKMQWYVANHYFLMNLRDKGLNNFLYEKPTGQHDSLIATEGSEPMNPLSGLYTTEDFRQGMEDVLNKWDGSELMRDLIRINSVIKYGKTILSPTTQMRNFQSASFFAMLNGHFNWTHAAKAFKVAKSDLFTKDAKWKAYINDMISLGVLHNNPYAGELRDAINDVTELDVYQKGIVQTGKKFLNWMQRAYQIGDDFWKVIGFENELEAFIKSGMPLEEARKKAAYRIRNGYPTYSMVPRLMKKIRRWPLIGTFVSFPYEIIRTSYNQAGFIAEDHKAGRTAMRNKRIIGMAIASSAAYAASRLSMMLMGMNDDDDEAVRAQLPEWSRNSQLAYIGYDEDGLPIYLDLSYLDPYTYIKKPLTALVSGNNEGFDKKIIDSLTEMAEPFIGIDIAAGTILEIWSNKKQSGGQVYNPEDTAYRIGKDITSHARKGLQPGLFSNVERTILALKGDTSRGGKEYKILDETLAWTGFRVGTLNLAQSLVYKGYGFSDTKRQSIRILSRAVGSRQKMSEDEIRDAFDSMIKARERVYKQMIKYVNGARTLGMDDKNILRALSASNISRKDIGAIVRGIVPPWSMGKDFIVSTTNRALSTTPNEEKKEEVKETMIERRRFVYELSKEYFNKERAGN